MTIPTFDERVAAFALTEFKYTATENKIFQVRNFVFPTDPRIERNIKQYTINLYLCKRLTDPWGNYLVSSVSEQRETEKKRNKLAGQRWLVP